MRCYKNSIFRCGEVILLKSLKILVVLSFKSSVAHELFFLHTLTFLCSFFGKRNAKTGTDFSIRINLPFVSCKQHYSFDLCSPFLSLRCGFGNGVTRSSHFCLHREKHRSNIPRSFSSTTADKNSASDSAED